MANIFYYKSLRPYLFIASFSALLVILGLVFNSGVIGALLGGSIAAIDFRYNPVFLLGIFAIYFIKKPYLAILTTIILAIFYQIYIAEFSDAWRLLGVSKPSYFSLHRVFGGVFLLSFMGFCHYVVRKFNAALPDDKTKLKSLFLVLLIGTTTSCVSENDKSASQKGREEILYTQCISSYGLGYCGTGADATLVASTIKSVCMKQREKYREELTLEMAANGKLDALQVSNVVEHVIDFTDKWEVEMYTKECLRKS